MDIRELKAQEYHQYYAPYIEILGAVILNEELENSCEAFCDLTQHIPETSFQYAYQDGKWTLAELLMHVLHTERIFQYRALRFSRNDMTELSGFEQDIFVANSNAQGRNKESIIAEFKMIRGSTISLYKDLTQGQLLRTGLASGSTISVRALGFLICGHQKHHLKILKERYL